MKYDELLNHKSILDCENPRDEEQHGKDKVAMLGKMESFGKYGAVVKLQAQDKGHARDKAKYLVVCPEDFQSVVEACDLKNGTDMVIHDGLVGIAVYGQNYTMGLKQETHMLETLCSYRFLNEKADFEKLREMDRKELEREFGEGEEFLSNAKLFEELRGVKRKDLDALIQGAEERRGNKGKEKAKEKEVGRE